MRVNPELKTPTPPLKILEFERVMTTRYRTGSHNLRIETGRICNPTIPREERICSCNTGVQSLAHCFRECPFLRDLYKDYQFHSIEDAFENPDIYTFLMKMEKILNVR